MTKVNVKWPNGNKTKINVGTSWIEAACQSGVKIPTGCLGGSCGACEIEVNGKVLRACITRIPESQSEALEVTFSNDPYW